MCVYVCVQVYVCVCVCAKHSSLKDTDGAALRAHSVHVTAAHGGLLYTPELGVGGLGPQVPG